MRPLSKRLSPTRTCPRAAKASPTTGEPRQRLRQRTPLGVWSRPPAARAHDVGAHQGVSIGRIHLTLRKHARAVHKLILASPSREEVVGVAGAWVWKRAPHIPYPYTSMKQRSGKGGAGRRAFDDRAQMLRPSAPKHPRCSRIEFATCDRREHNARSHGERFVAGSTAGALPASSMHT